MQVNLETRADRETVHVTDDTLSDIVSETDIEYVRVKECDNVASFGNENV